MSKFTIDHSCIIFLSGFAFAAFSALLVAAPFSYAQSPTAQDSPSVAIGKSQWYIRWGDSPLDDQGVPLWTYDDVSSPGWQPATGESHLLSNRQGHQFQWLMIPVPDGHWKHPGLLLSPVSQNVEVYQNHKLIYRSGKLESSYRNRYWIIRSHLIQLESIESTESGPLFLRIHSNSRYIGMEENKIWLGSLTGLIKTTIMIDLEDFILGPLFSFIGLFSIFIYFRRRGQKPYIVLSFGAFAICLGMLHLSEVLVIQLSTRATALRYYLALTNIVLWPVFLYVFVEQILGRGYKSLIRRLWQAHVLFAVVSIFLDVVVILPATTFVTALFGLLLIGIFIGLPICIKSALKGNFEARILGAGMGLIMLSGMHDILAAFAVIPRWSNLFAWSTFVFILLLAYILEYRFAQAHRQLEEYSLTLEQRVEDRTQELSEKNEALEQTLEQLKTTQHQLVMQEKMASLGNLVAGVAHEMNNPVGVIHSAADTTSRGIRKIKDLLRGDHDGEQLHQSFDLLEKNSGIITAASDRVAKIVQSLRSFARLDEALFQEVDIHQNIDTTLTLLSHELKDKTPVIKQYSEIPPIQCYPNELNQAFMNVLLNAAQAIGQQETITIATYADETQVYVKISDTGKGIPSEDLPQIFNPGFTTQSDGVGKGLGLSIVYNVVQKHHGDIKVDSEIGKGTEVNISLPIKQTRSTQE